MARSNIYRLRERRWKAYHEFEKKQMKKERRSFKEALAIFEGLWRLGEVLGAFKGRDPLGGIEKDIHLAKILNMKLKHV